MFFIFSKLINISEIIRAQTVRVLEIEFNLSPSCCVDDCLKLKLSMSPEYVIIGDWWGATDCW